jgi:NAD(P)-dependent dehydrogenase (short-subunit alcohol dehydrogenase family)
LARVFVTGSADGIGRQVALELADAGHQVVLHARNDERAGTARSHVPQAVGVAVGDVSSLAQTRALAADAAGMGPFDSVIHNVGVGSASRRTLTVDGLERIFQVNVLAPYVLTALMPRPVRLVYLTSGLAAYAVADLDDPQFEHTQWNGSQAYSSSKLFDIMLAFAVARLWPGVLSNAVDPGWIKTAMGGPAAPGELTEGAETSVWLAASDEPGAQVSGQYFSRRDPRVNPAAQDPQLQERLLVVCESLTGLPFPR